MEDFSFLENVRLKLRYLVLLGLITLYTWIAVKLCGFFYDENGATLSDAIEQRGLLAAIVLYAFSAGIYLGIPVAMLNIVGIVMFNPFSRPRTPYDNANDHRFICFRVVTRGLYPKLVQDVTERNLQTVLKCGIKNFKFEVVTDKQLNLTPSYYVREIVVPPNYTTPNGTLFKARALHYCLEPNISILSADDWLVHLDEETQLTESVLTGITNFIAKPNACIGQGVITYGGLEIENWFTTLLDGVRTAVDYGIFRLGLQLLHRPIFGFKGSFIVIKMSVEAKIGFDFGPKESIAEDLRFALTAWNRGYRFDFVDGVMQEKSTFSVPDFVKQRKRWFIGHFHIIWNNTLPLYCKVAVLPMHISNLLLWSNILNPILSLLFPVPVMRWQLFMFFALSMNIHFVIMFGNFMSLTNRRFNIVVKCLICFVSQLLVPCLGVLEAYAALKGFKDRNNVCFEIVQKETAPAANQTSKPLLHV